MDLLMAAASLDQLYAPSVLPPRRKEKYEFTFDDGNVVVHGGMMTRLCQEGHIFKMLILGGNGFINEVITGPIGTLQHYHISKKAFSALVFSLRNDTPKSCHKYRLQYESIGGFKFLDKYHKRMVQRKLGKTTPLNNDQTKQTRSASSKREVINLTSDDEEEDLFDNIG
tara:strand:- start:215 stop:721 length:507 start_codon:yes stop_codon:yes gene_type:complete